MADINAEIMHAAWRLPEKEKYFKGWTKAIGGSMEVFRVNNSQVWA